jgi:hypothetical protein
VLFQVNGFKINVFAEYLTEGTTAENAAYEILRLADERCGAAKSTGRATRIDGLRWRRSQSCRPYGHRRIRASGLRGTRGIEHWPKYPGSVQDSLQLVEALIRSADGTANLTIHPRCTRTIDALMAYSRAKRAGQYMDYPDDPQHPHEDLVDALRGGLKVEFMEGRRVPPKFTRKKAKDVF